MYSTQHVKGMPNQSGKTLTAHSIGMVGLVKKKTKSIYRKTDCLQADNKLV